MKTNPKPELLRFHQHSPGLVSRKHMRFTEHVRVTRETFGGNSRKHLVDNQPNVFLSPVSILIGNLVRAKESRNQIEWSLIVEPSNHPQDFQLVINRQSVAALCLDRCRAVFEERSRVLLADFEQLIFGCRPSFSHCRANSAASRSDLLIRYARGAHFVLVLASAGEYR